MDGAADSSLQHEIVSTLHDLKDTNVFVISHRTEGLVEKFQRNLHVTRHIGFSSIQETLI
jgi:ABC-type Mn2+/Zn2+ transport system ATPase subunit